MAWGRGGAELDGHAGWLGVYVWRMWRDYPGVVDAEVCIPQVPTFQRHGNAAARRKPRYDILSSTSTPHDPSSCAVADSAQSIAIAPPSHQSAPSFNT